MTEPAILDIKNWGFWLRVGVEKVIWLTVVRILRQPEFTT